MRDLPRIAAWQCGVFSAAQAYAEGWTTAALRHATRTGRLLRLRTGAYQEAELGALDTFERARWRHAGPAVAAALTTRQTFASHSTAAVLRGLPLLFLPRLSCVSVVPGQTGAMERVHLHRCRVDLASRPVGEVACLTDTRTALDLAREHGVAAGVVALDFALRYRRTDHQRLAAELLHCSRWPGARAAREAVRLADPLSESPLESHSRFALSRSGLPLPEPQVRLGNEWGGFVARVDFYWDELGVVGEADGAMKYEGTDREPLIREKKRQEALADLGLEIVRWGIADMHDFDEVVRRLQRAFVRAAARPAADRRWTVLPRLDTHLAPASVTDRRRW